MQRAGPPDLREIYFNTATQPYGWAYYMAGLRPYRQSQRTINR
jgi:hypothetical protein